MLPYNLYRFASCGNLAGVLLFVTLPIVPCAHVANAQAQEVDGGDGIACTLQFQIAVQKLEDVEGQDVNAGQWQVAVNWDIPIRSDGGPGQVTCVKDGAQIRIEWENAKLVNGGLRLNGFQWAIDNPIDRRDGVTHHGIGGRALPPSSEWFGSEFMPQASLKLDTARRQKSDRRLVFRARYLSKNPPLKRLNIPELTELESVKKGK